MKIANIASVANPISQGQSTALGETFAAAYSTTAAGKNYPANVEKSGGAFVASVPDMLGASASGVSVQAAENRLYSVINMMV